MRARLESQGGIAQEDRMIKDKYKTFLKTLQYSYQGCWVKKVQERSACKEITDAKPWRALINPDKTKQDYDDKILSIDYNSNFQPGDIFQWTGTNTHWLIYLQSLTEDAYFRGEIRLCKYKIKFKNECGKIVETWAAIRGPVETQINSIQKNQVRIDQPNLSLNILMPLNDDTRYAFDRYKEFFIQGEDRKWRVEAMDTISITGVLEVNAEEYYIDRDEDDVDEGIDDGLVIEKCDYSIYEDQDERIEGPGFIKPKIAEIYKAPEEGGEWSILESGFPVCLKCTTDKHVQLTWCKTVSGQFTLLWKKEDTMLQKTVVVESLF